MIDATVTERAPAVICLASASPRRRELLQQIGVPHIVQPADLDETARPHESPLAYVERLARDKAEWVRAKRERAGAPPLPVLGADTTVTIDGLLLGKPVDEQDFLGTIGKLAGRTHEVLSAVALSTRADTRSAVSMTRVSFRAIGAEEARRYWASGEPRDKAGGYAIQGLGAVFVQHIDGSYSGVMGLPIAETAALLVAAGVGVWHSGA